MIDLNPPAPLNRLPLYDRLIPVLLLPLLALLPPEARGESLAGAAALIALAFGLGLARPLPGTVGTALVLGVATLLPASLLAAAPGVVVAPIVVLVLAVALGHVAGPPFGDEGRRAVPGALALAGVAVALWGVQQALGGLAALADRIDAVQGVADADAIVARLRAGRAFAGFPTPAAFAGYLVLALPVTVGLAVGARGGRRAAWAVAALVQGAGFVAAASGSAMLAIAGAVALGAFWLPRVRRFVLPVVALVALAAATAFALRGGELTVLSDPGSPWRLRVANYRIATEIIADHPWTGVGPGGYGEVYPAYRREGDNESRHVHNLPLEWCAEWGLPLGLLGSAAFFALFLAPLRRASRETDTWRIGAAVGLAAFALHNLADFTAMLPSVLWSAALLRGRLGASRSTTAPRSAASRSALPAMVALAIAAVLAGLGGLAWNERVLARQAIAEADWPEAERHAESARRLAPWHPDGWLETIQAGLSAAPESGPSTATASALLPAAEHAIAASPVRPSARLLRARLRLALGDVPGAWVDADRAAALYPLRRDYADFRDRLHAALPAVEE